MQDALHDLRGVYKNGSAAVNSNSLLFEVPLRSGAKKRYYLVELNGIVPMLQFSMVLPADFRRGVPSVWPTEFPLPAGAVPLTVMQFPKRHSLYGAFQSPYPTRQTLTDLARTLESRGWKSTGRETVSSGDASGCSQLVRALKELEANGCINAGKSIMVIPVINALGMNVSRRFFGVENMDINRMFPGKEDGDTTDRIAFQIFEKIKGYTYGIQLTSFYMTGEFVPHVRMMETGYQNTSLANLFGLPYVVVRKPTPIDTKTLNYNWQNEMTAAFSVYTNKNDTIDEKSARQAVAAVLRFLTRMGIIRYESHSGYISHVIMDLLPR